MQGGTKTKAGTLSLSYSKKGQAASMSLLTFVAGHGRPKSLQRPQRPKTFPRGKVENVGNYNKQEKRPAAITELVVALTEKKR